MCEKVCSKSCFGFNLEEIDSHSVMVLFNILRCELFRRRDLWDFKAWSQLWPWLTFSAFSLSHAFCCWLFLSCWNGPWPQNVDVLNALFVCLWASLHFREQHRDRQRSKEKYKVERDGKNTKKKKEKNVFPIYFLLLWRGPRDFRTDSPPPCLLIPKRLYDCDLKQTSLDRKSVV